MVNERFVSAIAAGFFLLAVFDFRVVPFLWTALLIVGLAGLLFREWPKLVLVCWDSLTNRRVQTVVAGLVVLSLWVDFSGFRGVLAAAQKAPENELGSYWELAGIVINVPIALVAAFASVFTFFVTRSLMQQQNMLSLTQGIMPMLISSDGSVVDFKPVKSDFITGQVEILFDKMSVVCTPGELAKYFRLLNRWHALEVIDFCPAGQQHNTDDRGGGRPLNRIFFDPRKEPPAGARRQGIRAVQLDQLTPLLEGRSIKGFLRGVHFVYADFVRTSFDGSDLQDAVFVGSTHKSCSFRNADLRHLQVMLSDKEYREACDFGYSDPASRWFAVFTDCDFAGSKMTPSLFCFLQEYGRGSTISSVLDAIICTENGREITGRAFQAGQRSV